MDAQLISNHLVFTRQHSDLMNYLCNYVIVTQSEEILQGQPNVHTMTTCSTNTTDTPASLCGMRVKCTVP